MLVVDHSLPPGCSVRDAEVSSDSLEGVQHDEAVLDQKPALDL